MGYFDLHAQDFFKKHGVAVMTIRELFDFIVDPTISDETVDSYLEEVCVPFYLESSFNQWWLQV